MKRALAVATFLVATVVPSLSTTAWASGGSGGGGTGGGGTTTTTTGGGGGGKTACSPSITLTAAASTVPGVRSLTASYNTNCAPKSRVALTATNVATGIVEWTAPVDSINTSYTWNAPLFGATYRIDARVYSNLGPFLTSATTTVTTLAAPPDCGPFLTSSAAVGSTAADYGITSSYSLVWCAGVSTVLVTATNTTTGLVEFSQYAGALTSVTWATPKFNTTYRVEVVAYDGVAILARSSNIVTTIPTPPNCATITNENLTTGYWGIYAAIWISATAKDCGYGQTSLHMKITNTKSGLVEWEAYNLPLSYFMDFEGTITKYDTVYQIDVEVRGASNEILDSSTSSILTPPLR